VQLRRTARGAQSWSLVVEDQGTADSTQAATPVPERPGTGLGLDIVRRTAARAGGNAAVGRTPGGGFRVEVRVPDNAAQTAAPTPSPGDEPPPPSRARPASTAAVTYRRAVLRSTPACAAAVRSPAPASHARCTSRISVTAASRNAIPRTPKSIDLKAPGTGSDQDPQAGTPGGPITATGWSHARARKSHRAVPCSWQATEPNFEAVGRFRFANAPHSHQHTSLGSWSIPMLARSARWSRAVAYRRAAGGRHASAPRTNPLYPRSTTSSHSRR